MDRKSEWKTIGRILPLRDLPNAKCRAKYHKIPAPVPRVVSVPQESSSRFFGAAARYWVYAKALAVTSKLQSAVTTRLLILTNILTYLDKVSCYIPKPQAFVDLQCPQSLPKSLVKFTTSGSVSNPHTTESRCHPVPSIPQLSLNSLLPLPTNPAPFFKHKSESVNTYQAPGGHQPTRSTGSQEG